MTFAAALTAVWTRRRPFWHRERAVPTEREAPNDRVAVPAPDPVDWQRRLQADTIMHGLIGSVLRSAMKGGGVGNAGPPAYDRAVHWRLLVGVSDAERQHLMSVARRRRFDRHEVVFHRDDPADSLHLIVKGRFAVRIMTPVGDTVTISVLGPYDSFGEMALIGGEARRSATVHALERAETLALYKDDFERLRAQHPAVNDVLLRFLVGELRAMNERLLEALYVPSERRVLRRLKELTVGGVEGEGGIEVPLTQEELAELSGTSRSTVNRVLRQEEKRGTVALQRGRTTVLDRDALARRAR